MTDELEQLQRFEVGIAVGRLPPDVAAWAIDKLRAMIPAHRREAERVRLIRAAGTAIGGSVKGQAGAIRAKALILLADWSHFASTHADLHGIDGKIHRALQLDRSMGISISAIMRVLPREGVAPRSLHATQGVAADSAHVETRNRRAPGPRRSGRLPRRADPIRPRS